MRIKLKYLCRDVDRHGNVRFYVRAPGKKKIRLAAAPTTDEYFKAYRQAIGQGDPTDSSGRIKAGSFRELVARYVVSTKFKGLDVSTQNWQRRSLEDICRDYGTCLVETMRGKHVRAIRNEKVDAGLPAAGNHRLKAMRAMFKWGVEEEECENNPTLGVQKYNYQTDGHHQWTDEQMAQYRDFYPLGTKQPTHPAVERMWFGSARSIGGMGGWFTVKPRTSTAAQSISTFRFTRSWPRASTPSAPST